MTGFDLAGEESQRCSDEVAGLGLGRFPGQRMESVTDRQVEELVPGRMELDLVDPVAVSVVSSKFGGVAIGEEAPLVHLRGCHPSPEFSDRVHGPAAAVPLEGVDQGRFRSRNVVAIERGRLVQDLVGGDRSLLDLR